MKKLLTLSVAVLLIGALVIPAALAAEKPEYGDWFDQMFQWHNQWIDDAVENNQMTGEQAKAWKDHFNYMREFHSQYPMGMMMGGYGMMGPGYGENAGHGGYMGSGYGMGGYGGMMGGYGYGQNNSN